MQNVTRETVFCRMDNGRLGHAANMDYLRPHGFRCNGDTGFGVSKRAFFSGAAFSSK